MILGGAFHIRASSGAVVAGPGAIVLGNPGGAYEYRHVDDGGDRSLVFEYDAALLDDAAASHRLRAAFRLVSVPGSPAATEAVVLARHALCSGDRDALEEAALAAAGVAVAHVQAGTGTGAAWSLAQARRIASTLRYVEAHSDRDCSLRALAAHAGLSRYHFLRLFRATTGQTPHQHVIATRLRAAAAELRETRTPITQIALDAGFGDVSHFTATFTRRFGASPRAYRKREASR